MITSIHLVNWRSHADSLLHFKKGTNLLVGLMGAGKSSVLDGISYALFGIFPALERRKVKLIDILRTNQESASVTLELKWKDSTYKIVRTLTRRKDTVSADAFLYKDKMLLERGAVLVNRYVEKLLSTSYDLFSRAIYSEQNNIDYFFSITPRHRKEEMDKLLGLDRFEIARSNITTLFNRINDSRKLLEKKFNPDRLGELLKKLAETEAKEHALKESMNNINAQLEESSKTLKETEEQFSAMKKKKSEHELLSKRQLQLQAVIKNIQDELGGRFVDQSVLSAPLEERNALEKERLKFRTQLKELDAQLSSLSEKIGSIDARLATAARINAAGEEANKRLTNILKGRTSDEMRAQLAELEKKVLDFHSERKSLLKEIAELEELAGRLTPDLSKCPLCGNDLSAESLNHIKKEKAAQLSAKRKRVGELFSFIKDVEDEHARLKKAIQEVDLLKERIHSISLERQDTKELEGERTKAVMQLGALKEKKSSLQQSDAALTEQLERIAIRIKEIEDLIKKSRELVKAETEMKEVLSKLAELSFDEGSYEKLRERFEDARVTHQKLLAAKGPLEVQLRSLTEMRALVEKEATTQKEMATEIETLSRYETELAIFKNALLETQLGLRTELINAINLAMEELWPVFYPHRNYSMVRLSVSEKDYFFELFDGEWRSLESVASGGERACAALTLRVALAMVLTPNLSWLILDEPTHNLDKDAVDLLSQALQYKVPEVVEQTFVITHDEGLVGSEFAASYRLQRDKNAGGATLVEQL